MHNSRCITPDEWLRVHNSWYIDSRALTNSRPKGHTRLLCLDRQEVKLMVALTRNGKCKSGEKTILMLVLVLKLFRIYFRLNSGEYFQAGILLTIVKAEAFRWKVVGRWPSERWPSERAAIWSFERRSQAWKAAVCGKFAGSKLSDSKLLISFGRFSIRFN